MFAHATSYSSPKRLLCNHHGARICADAEKRAHFFEIQPVGRPNSLDIDRGRRCATRPPRYRVTHEQAVIPIRQGGPCRHGVGVLQDRLPNDMSSMLLASAADTAGDASNCVT